MEPTARLEVVDVRAGSAVAGTVAASAALAAGVAALAADRAGRAVERAVASAGGPVTLVVHPDGEGVVLELRGGGDGWPAVAARVLEGIGACTEAVDGVDVRIAVPPMHGTPPR